MKTMSVKDQVIDFLEHTPRLSDYYDDATWIADKVNIILNDSEDDKIGRIRDVYRETFEALATFIEDKHDETPAASWLYNEIVDEDFLEDEDE